MDSIQRWFRRLLIQVLVITASAVAPALTHGESYYVAKTGSDSNSCAQAQSASTPKLTINSGMACLSRSGTLIIGDGTYAERLTTFVSGTSTSPTTIRAANNRRAIIRPASGAQSVLMNNVSWVVLDGLVVDGINTTSTGILTTGTSSDITLQNGEVKNVKGSVGSDGSGTCIATNVRPRIKIKNMLIHDCALVETSGHSHGIYLSGPSSLVEYSEIYNAKGHGIHQFHTRSGVENDNIIRYNYVHDNTSRGILIGSGSNNIAHHNVVRNNSHGIGVGFGTTVNAQVYNNTIYSNRASCVEVRSTSSDAIIKNNLCLSNSTNMVTNLGLGTMQVGNKLSTEATLVVDAVNNKFTPRVGSALIDAGVVIVGFSSGKFLGSAPDQGALEFTASVGTPPSAPINLSVRN